MANTGSARAEKKSAAKDDAAKDSGAGGPGGSAGLKIHHLRPAPGARTAKTRVGRGEASKGKTAGRGTKGSKARTTISPAFEGGQMPLHRRLPKLKGFSNARFKTTYQVVNLDRLAALYPQGGDVTLGNGEAVSGLRVSAHAFSATAVQKITAAGGTTTQL